MSLETLAQLIVVDPETPLQEMPVSPLEVSMPHHEHLEITDDAPQEIIIELTELPGAPSGTQDPKEEPELEVVDESDEKDEDENEARKSKNDKWDWESKGSEGFIVWIKSRIDDVPKHSGYDSAGLERAISYLEKLDNEISKAMRLDLDGELDANKIEEVRSQIDDGLNRLHSRLDKVKKVTKHRRKKKADFQSEIIKEGQKITGVKGIYIVAPLFISRIARICINGMVSAGHDIEDLYAKQVKKWNLTEREQAEVQQLLFDMGVTLRSDRGYMPDEDIDIADNDNFDWSAQYKA